MPILQIAPVTRRGMKLMISLYGLSETGKTMSALRLAAGIEPDPQKRMLLDTEGGQRGRAYTDHIDGGYLYAQLSRPFTPERYIQALDEIEQAGVNVLVIDSISHAWFGEGGILDMVDEIPGDNFAKWKKPKRRLAKMTQRLMGSDMHIILCARAKEPLIDGPAGRDGKPTKIRGPVVPIQERTLWYDLTIVAQMLGDGEFDITRPQGKCPGMLRPFFAEGKVMDEALGRKLAAWAMAEGGKSPEHRRLELDAMSAAEAGVEAFRRFWSDTSIEQRALINANRGNYQSIATAADREREEQQANGEAADEDATVTAEALKIQAAGATAGKPTAAAAPEKTAPPAADTKDPAADEPPAVDLTPYQIAMPRRQDGSPHYTAWRGQIADRLAEAQDLATVDRLREANADWIDAAAGSDVETERKEAQAIESRFADARKRITATTTA